jgi:hypothetical protein
MRILVDGSIDTGSSRIDGTITLRDLSCGSFAREFKCQELGGGWIRAESDLDGWSVVLTFRGERLFQCLLCAKLGREAGWSSWTAQGEAQRHALHCERLREWLGKEHVRTSWGTVEAMQDDKGGFSAILVRFAPAMRSDEATEEVSALWPTAQPTELHLSRP